MRKWMRLWALVLALCTLCGVALAETELRGYDNKNGYVYLTLGEFPQTADGGVKPIVWRVLAVEGGRAYILSEYVLEARRIHGDYKEYSSKSGFNGDFTRTELYLYMNGDFAMTRFTDGERALIAVDDELGMFFAVSADDLKDKALGFGTNQSRKAWATDYARENGLFVYGSKYGKHSPYWTRDQSTSDARHARCTKDQGELGRINVITEDLGMRPACFLDMTKVVILSGAGTLEDPFVLDAGEPSVQMALPLENTDTNDSADCNCVPEGEKCDCCDCCSCSLR